MRDQLLSLACFGRREFFKYWNQLSSSEDYALAEVEEKLKAVLEKWTPPQRKIHLSGHQRFISLLDEDYPRVFLELPQPPLGVFLWGPMDLNQEFVGVVGSRKPVSYAKRLCRRLVMKWAETGVAIVSGGAMGIDREAHEAALDVGGKTLVVLGSGFSHLHPKSNHQLFSRIPSENSAFMSEYPPWEAARPYYFPERNRLIAALSEKLVIAQAHAKSGSLSTARTAMDLGKEILVLRPPPGDENFAGSQDLIDSGASCLNRFEDLFGPDIEPHRYPL